MSPSALAFESESPSAVILAFPGQGVEPQALQTALEASQGDPLVEHLMAIFDCDSCAEIDLRREGMAEASTYVASVVRARVLVDRAVLVLGHSLGEIAALAVAGAFDEVAGLNLVMARSALCGMASMGSPGVMHAVIGLGEDTLVDLCHDVATTTGEILVVAAVNSNDQVVVSGTRRASDELTRLVMNSKGCSVVRLPIAGGFHSPLMSGAQPAFRAQLADLEIGNLRVPWLSTVDSECHSDSARIVDRLVDALVMPVRWSSAVEQAAAHYRRPIVDVGPSDRLARLGRDVAVRALDEYIAADPLSRLSR